MNTISFANIDSFDKQTGFFPEGETDEKTIDFSSILNNIFVALQTRDLPVKNEFSIETSQDFKTSVAVSPEQDFTVQNSQDENNLPELQKLEIAPELPALQTLWAGGHEIRQRMNNYKSEIKSDQKFTPQPAELFQAEADPKTEKPGIIITCESTNLPLAGKDQKPFDFMALPQLFQASTDSIKENSLKVELAASNNPNNPPPNFDLEPNPLNIVLKPKFVDNKLTGFDLTPNEINSILETFETFMKGSAKEVNVIGSAVQNSVSNVNFTNSKSNQLQDIWWNDQSNSEKTQNTGQENDFEFDLSVKFDKLFSTLSKNQKSAEIVQNNQAEPAKVAEQINPHLLELAALTIKKNEKQTLRLRLYPAELGTVEIKLEQNNAGTLNAYFQTETEGARTALTNNLDQLRDSLQNAGWQIGQMEITNGSFSSTANQHRENQSRQSESVANYSFSRSSEQPGDLEQNASNRLLSLLA